MMHLLRPVDLVATELVRDAVELTVVPDPSPRWTALANLTMIRLRLALIADGVVIEVADRHPEPPVFSAPLTISMASWTPSNQPSALTCCTPAPHSGKPCTCSPTPSLTQHSVRSHRPR